MKSELREKNEVLGLRAHESIKLRIEKIIMTIINKDEINQNHKFINSWKMENLVSIQLLSSQYNVGTHFLICSSRFWSILWTGVTRQVSFKLSSFFFFTISRSKACNFSYSSSQVENMSKQNPITYIEQILHKSGKGIIDRMLCKNHPQKLRAENNSNSK